MQLVDTAVTVLPCTLERLVFTCWLVVEALICLEVVVGLETGRIEHLGLPLRPREKTEKKGLAQGIVAEITLTWQVTSDMICSRIASAAGFSLKTLAWRGFRREALGTMRRRRRAKAITTLALVLKGIWMLQTRWIAPASKASSRTQEQMAVASRWPHWRERVNGTTSWFGFDGGGLGHLLGHGRCCWVKCPRGADICFSSG
jgi:hypothetical protein